jgi:uncharacterized membrane protein YhaH (DUF805 family)
MESYLSFNGRIGRQTYWLAYCLPAAAISFVSGVIDGANGQVDGIGPAYLLAILVCFVPSLAGGVKRCHDRGKSGWWLLLSLIPVLGMVWALIDLGCLRGTVGPNDYGEDPVSTSRAAATA